jgi:hypothetical protein
METLTTEYRHSLVRHADGTGWRNDGQSGFAWLFCTRRLAIFLFKNTRSASVPKSVFGSEKLPGFLIVDRYSGYNNVPVKIQYCYAHLLRDVKKLVRDAPDEKEVAAFTGTLIPLLAQAMHPASQDSSDGEYYRQAHELKDKIMAVCRSPGNPGHLYCQ